MLPEQWGRLPVRVRPVAHETVASYEARLRSANGYSSRSWNTGMNAAIRRGEAKENVLAALGAFPATLFSRGDAHTFHSDGTACDRCVTGLVDRYGCLRCTDGAVARQHPHDGPRVCRRHMQWIGPGIEASDQFSVGPEVLSADRLYRRMRRRGQVDAHRLAELLGCVGAWADASGSVLDPAERFRLAVALARRMSGSATQADDASLQRGAYAWLSIVVGEVADGESLNVLVDALWTLLRASRFQGADDRHRFRSLADHEHFESEFDTTELTSSFYPRFRHLQLTQLVSANGARTRFLQATRLNDSVDYVCVKRHRFPSTGTKIRNSKASMGCTYCARKKMAPGYSLADEHPDIAGEWHPTMNGDVRPTDVFAGTADKYFWLCPEEGHHYDASPGTRVYGRTECPICLNRRVTEANSLRSTHPHLVSQWNWTLNADITPDDVTAGSSRDIWWICVDEGHDFEMTPVDRAGGRKCGVCTRRVMHASTSLAATNPEIAATWHPTRNGDLTPADVFAGSPNKAWWKCENGCDYDSAILSRLRGFGCRYCANRTVSTRNCMRQTHPVLAAEFHPTKNGSMTPDILIAGTRETLWWQCATHGHEWPATGNNRVKGNNCPTCANKRVLAGFNDMATTRPDLAAEIHPSKNGSVTASEVLAGTSRPLWWKCGVCGDEWEASGDQRSRGLKKCQTCRKVARQQRGSLPPRMD
jgi:hypothetical protein